MRLRRIPGGTLPDLAVVNQNDNTISILLNQDNGNFVAQANSPVKLGANEMGPVAIATGTFGNTVVNSDGVTVAPVDLVIANSTTNNVTVLLGNDDGTFTEAPGSPYAVGKNPSSVVVADLNGDGDLDFAVSRTKATTRFRSSKAMAPENSRRSRRRHSRFRTTRRFRKKDRSRWPAANFKNTTLPNSTAPEVDLAIVNENSNNVDDSARLARHQRQRHLHRSDEFADRRSATRQSRSRRAI